MSPMIAHTASLIVATKEFAKSRTSLEEILVRHRGYAARLRMAGRRTGSVLSATLRVPSSELGATVSDLKSLGDVEQEEQSADEITQQHADLEARLANAQATLRRLEELLKKQTYPDGNVRELQRQIAMASAAVNRLESERSDLASPLQAFPHCWYFSSGADQSCCCGWRFSSFRHAWRGSAGSRRRKPLRLLPHRNRTANLGRPDHEVHTP